MLNVTPERFAHRPVIKNVLENSTFTMGSNMTLECGVITDQPPFITWLRHPTIDPPFDPKTGNISDRRSVIKVWSLSTVCRFVSLFRFRDFFFIKCIINLVIFAASYMLGSNSGIFNMYNMVIYFITSFFLLQLVTCWDLICWKQK